MRIFAKAGGIEIVGRYIDVGVLGYEMRPEDREQWSRAVEHALKKDAVILISSLDRIARHYDYLVETLDRLRSMGIQVAAYQEEWLQPLSAILDESLRKLVFDVIVRALA